MTDTVEYCGYRLPTGRTCDMTQQTHEREDLGHPFTVPTASDARGSSWGAVDLTAVLDGTYRPPMPTVGQRDDGAGLFYPGRIHTIASESEGGKTWFALLAAFHELRAGNGVAYLDFEDDEGGVVGRLLALGATPAQIRARFAYIRPEESIEALTNRADLDEVLYDYKPVTLAVLDGITEAMTLHGLEIKDNGDIARFGKMLPRWLADNDGPAVAALDHVTKDREGRGRYAIGGVHKLNGVNGAAYLLENRTPFGIGLTGRSTITIAKDRPGQLRRRGLPSANGLFWYADLEMKSHDETFVEASLTAPIGQETSGLRPTHVMTKISRALADAPQGLSKAAVEAAVGGNRGVARLALELLIGEGHVRADGGGPGKATIHKLVNPYEGDSQ